MDRRRILGAHSLGEGRIPSVLSHPAPALALATLFPSLRSHYGVLAAGALCAIAPDLDSIGLRLGVPYDSMWGHRGFTHSLTFAVLLGGAVALLLRGRVPGARWGSLWLYLFAATATHGFFDALTDGGMGVATFAPFSGDRYFFPVRPIEVSPLNPSRFVSGRGLSILTSEAVWIWLPSLVFAAIVLGAPKLLGPRGKAVKG